MSSDEQAEPEDDAVGVDPRPEASPAAERTGEAQAAENREEEPPA